MTNTEIEEQAQISVLGPKSQIYECIQTLKREGKIISPEKGKYQINRNPKDSQKGNPDKIKREIIKLLKTDQNKDQGLTTKEIQEGISVLGTISQIKYGLQYLKDKGTIINPKRGIYKINPNATEAQEENQVSSPDLSEESVSDNEDANEQSNSINVSGATRDTLNNLRLQNQDVNPDGDCLYNALITMGLTGYNSASVLRQQLADYVIRNYDDNNELQVIVHASELNLDAFADAIRTPGSFDHRAGDSTAELLSMFLHINIYVINNQNGSVTRTSEDPNNPIYYLVRFDQVKHYNATRSLD